VSRSTGPGGRLWVAARRRGLLGVDDHPALQVRPNGKKIKPAKLCVILAKIVYHCDIDNLFLDSRKAGRYHNKRNLQMSTVKTKILKGQQEGTVRSVSPLSGLGVSRANRCL
jgi:hypothetical protein